MNGRPSPDQRPAPRRRDQRGAVLPSPVVWLSIVAVVVAAFAFVATRDADPKEREITTSSADDETTRDPPTPTDDETSESDDPTDGTTTPDEPKTTKPPVERSEVGVVVFNNTSITGLAGETLARVQEIGWNGIAADNWYGTIPATTVYFPPGMRDAAQKLALDLGIQRLVPADAGDERHQPDRHPHRRPARNADHPIGRSFTWQPPGYCAFRDWLDTCSSRRWRVSIATRTWSA